MNESDAAAKLLAEPYAQTGCVFTVRATPGAKRNGVTGLHQGMLKVAVTQVAEQGKANPQILQVLAEFLQVKRSQLEILTGATSRQKKVACLSLLPQQLQERVACGLDETGQT